MTPLDYQQAVAILGRRTAVQVLEQWRRVDRGSIRASWSRLVGQAVAIVTAGQLAAADLADPYLDDQVGPGGPRIVPRSLAGVAADGRTLEGLLLLPQIEALTLVGQGVLPATALGRGASTLAMYARTSVTDAARGAVAAGMAARPECGGYYRQLSPPSCSRCAILAGRWYRWNRGFARHPHCDCVHRPARAPDQGGYDARQAILDGQVTGLSAADTEAIRLGASPASVVNARRGMTTAGTTTEGTTRTGLAGMRMRSAGLTTRPMPEQILQDATSREDAIRQLYRYGYIVRPGAMPGRNREARRDDRHCPTDPAAAGRSGTSGPHHPAAYAR